MTPILRIGGDRDIHVQQLTSVVGRTGVIQLGGEIVGGDEERLKREMKEAWRGSPEEPQTVRASLLVLRLDQSMGDLALE